MIQRVGVVGAGTMGAGIAQLCAQSGFAVKLVDVSPEAIERAKARILAGIETGEKRGKLTTDQAMVARRAVGFGAKLEELDGAELVIEAASEDLGVKRKIFKTLGEVLPGALLATNTSSLSIAAIADGVASPGRVFGTHFFNPPYVMKLVEMIRGPQTDPRAFQEAWEFMLQALRRFPVDVKDTPGFIVNRIMRPYYLEGQRAALAGAGIAALDADCREKGGVPMGPLELMDLIGLDVNLDITRVIYEALGKPERFKPVALQEKLVAAGANGRKAGKGFYLYDGKKKLGENPDAVDLIPPATQKGSWSRIRTALMNEAELLHKEGVAGKADIDMAVKLAMNFPKGPFELQRLSE